MAVPTERLGSLRTVAARANAAALGFGEIATWALFVTLALTGFAGMPDSIEPLALIAKRADAHAVLLAFPPIPIEVRQKRVPPGREQFASDWRHRRHRDDHRMATERSAAGTPHAGLQLIVGSPTPMGDATAIRLNAVVGVTAR